jgi:4,5-DOPA dioxygenase extradiol
MLNPAVPAGAYDDFLPGALPRARAQRQWTPADRPPLALYLADAISPMQRLRNELATKAQS